MNNKKGPNVFSVLKDYMLLVWGLLLFSILSNGLGLLLPKIIAQGIDAYTSKTIVLSHTIFLFAGASILVLLCTYAQSLFQVFASERVARDLRYKISSKISKQSYLSIQKVTPAKLLTNLTSDVDSIKQFVSQAVVSIVSSVLLIVGSSALLLYTNWRLALVVLIIIPLIGGTFFFVFSKMTPLFKKSREILDWLNKVINESIIGAGLIRVLNSQSPEYDKFIKANAAAQENGFNILRLFTAVIPIITFISSLATVAVLSLGGHFVVQGSMTLGDFSAFNSYIGILIFPLIIIGFMSSVIGQASASYARISLVLNEPEMKEGGNEKTDIRGDISLDHVSITLNQKPVLKDVTFNVSAGSKTAIIGPTAAGKTQLLYLLIGLIRPDSGTVNYDGKNIDSYSKEALHAQVGFVFQDSIMFNLSIRENIAFSASATNADLQKAVDTAELADFIDALPDGLDTVVSERGTSLSGGQKQRIMLARALALNPKVLLLDDFTARVDSSTEKKILENIEKNYPDITLVSVTQKISSIEAYDQIVVLMEGEVLAHGTHEELMNTSTEYVQIYDSQRSTNQYETV